MKLRLHTNLLDNACQNVILSAATLLTILLEGFDIMFFRRTREELAKLKEERKQFKEEKEQLEELKKANENLKKANEELRQEVSKLNDKSNK